MSSMLATVTILAGIALWLLAVKAYLDDPGCGGFDMNTAPAIGAYAVRRIDRASLADAEERTPTGFKALNEAERDAKG